MFFIGLKSQCKFCRFLNIFSMWVVRWWHTIHRSHDLWIFPRIRWLTQKSLFSPHTFVYLNREFNVSFEINVCGNDCSILGNLSIFSCFCLSYFVSPHVLVDGNCRHYGIRRLICIWKMMLKLHICALISKYKI